MPHGLITPEIAHREGVAARSARAELTIGTWTDPPPAVRLTAMDPIEHPETGGDATSDTATEPGPTAEAELTGGPSTRLDVARFVGLLAAAVLGGALTLGALAASGWVSIGRPAAASLSPSASPSAGRISAFASGRTIGRPDAPMTIEIWADFQCPFCGLFTHAVEPSLVLDYAAVGRARIAYRDFAFLGAESTDAAVAARCADRQGAFWRYHDLLFASQRGENQGTFARANLLQLAGFAGLEGAPFASCLDDSAVRAAVESETERGRSFGVTSTPTIRVIGPAGTETLAGLAPFAKVEAAIACVENRATRPSTGCSSPSAPPSPSASP